MLTIKTLEVGDSKTNCYLIFDETSKKCLIVDPGDDGEYIKDNILRNELIPVAIAVTHAHTDHLMSVMDIKLSFNIPFMMAPGDTPLLLRLSKSSYIKKNQILLPKQIDKKLNNGDKIDLGDGSVKVMLTPGHTPGSLTLLVNTPVESLLVGDLIFADGLTGDANYSYSNKEKLNQSIARVLSFNDAITIYPGHGVPFLVSKAKEIFPNCFGFAI